MGKQKWTKYQEHEPDTSGPYSPFVSDATDEEQHSVSKTKSKPKMDMESKKSTSHRGKESKASGNAKKAKRSAPLEPSDTQLTRLRSSTKLSSETTSVLAVLEAAAAVLSTIGDAAKIEDWLEKNDLDDDESIKQLASITDKISKSLRARSAPKEPSVRAQEAPEVSEFLHHVYDLLLTITPRI